MEPEIEQLPIGTRFQIEQRLGAGTFGVVYRAYDRERQMRVALKSLRRVSPKTIYNFKQEFRSLAGLVHPNLAALYELFSVDEHWFFTMELVEGVDFLAYVRQSLIQQPNVSDAAETLAATDHPTLPEGFRKSRAVQLPPLSEGRLSGALAQLAEGVHALHQAGKLHRDLKPSNVLVTPNGRVAILDFGLVTDQEAAARSDGAVVGTAAYMAPEQAAGTSIGPAADWYSVGVMLYQAITGRLPFEGGVKEVLHLKQREDAPHPLVMEPSAPVGLSEIAVSLLLREPNKRTSGADLLQRLGVEPSQAGGEKALFVGREDLLDELRAAATESRDRARGVRVFGASGMGKSVLLRAFMEELKTGGALVLAGRCYEYENVPFKALDSAVDALCRYLLPLPLEASVALIGPGAKALAKLFPVLRRLPAFAHADEPESPDPTEQRRAAASCLRGIFERLAAKGRVALWIDDLQWGDLDSVALLEELFRPPAPPLLFLMSYRSELAAGSELLNELARPGVLRGLQASDLEVKPLAMHEALDLALLLLGEGDLASQARPDVIARESRGNPYFVSELVRYARRGHRGEAPTLDSALAARIQDLPEEERRILDLAAIAGRPVPRWLLCRAARTPIEENRALSALLVKNLLAASGFGRDDQVECYHDRVREATASQLSRGQRQELHAALAAGLLSEGSPDPEAMVEHLVGAGQANQAAEYAAVAAEQAAGALAFDRAARLYQQAIELGAKGKPELTLKRAASLSNAGRSLAAAEVYLDASQDAPLKEATALREKAAQELLRGGDITRGRALLSALLAAADLPMAPSASRAMMSVVWRRLRIELRGLKFQESPAEQLDPAELRRVDLCWTAAIGLGNLDTIHGADFQARGLLLALKTGEPNRMARALSAEAAFLASEGGKHQKKITGVLARAAGLVERHDAPYNQAFLTMIRGEVAFLARRLPTRQGAPARRARAAHHPLPRRLLGDRHRALLLAVLSLLPRRAAHPRQAPGPVQPRRRAPGRPLRRNHAALLDTPPPDTSPLTRPPPPTSRSRPAPPPGPQRVEVFHVPICTTPRS